MRYGSWVLGALLLAVPTLTPSARSAGEFLPIQALTSDGKLEPSSTTARRFLALASMDLPSGHDVPRNPVSYLALGSDSYLIISGGGPIVASGLFLVRFSPPSSRKLFGAEVEPKTAAVIPSGERVQLFSQEGYGYTRMWAVVTSPSQEPRATSLLTAESDMTVGGCGDSPQPIQVAGEILSSTLADAPSDRLPDIVIEVRETNCLTKGVMKRVIRFRHDSGAYVQ